MAAVEEEAEEEEEEVLEACWEVEEEVVEEWMMELLTVRMVGMEEDLLVEEGRTGRSSSTSWGVREMAEEVETSQRTSERTWEDSFSSARRYPILSCSSHTHTHTHREREREREREL